MTRQTLTATVSAPLSGMEAAFRRTLRTLAALAVRDPALETLEAEQARIRATSRHWLLG